MSNYLMRVLYIDELGRMLLLHDDTFTYREYYLLTDNDDITHLRKLCVNENIDIFLLLNQNNDLLDIFYK